MSDIKLIEPKFRKSPRERRKQKYDRLGYGLAGASALGFGAAMSKIIKNKLDQDYGKVDKKNSGGVMLKGKQKKLDKNKDGKITGADFALMRKSGYKMGGMLKASSGASADRMTKRDIESATVAANNLIPKDNPDVKKRYNSMTQKDKTMKQAQWVESGIRDMKSKKMTRTEGSFKTGGVMKASSGNLAETMKKLRKKVYEKSMKKNKKVGKFGDDEYLIQKPLPGMKKGKMVKAKDGDFIERRKKLGGYKAVLDINPMQSDLEKMGPSAFLMRRATLAGASTLGSSSKPITKKLAKDAVKVGLGAGAGYEYAKSKKDKSKKDK